MIKQIAGDELFAEILLLKSASKKAILVVEGASDSLALTPHVDENSTQIIIGHSRTTVEHVMDLVDRQNVKLVVGVIDSDLDNYVPNRKSISSPNVVRTEHYDLEADIYFVPGVAERLAINFSVPDKLKSYLSNVGMATATEVVVKVAAQIGYVRLTSILEGHDLNTRSLAVESFLVENVQLVDYTTLAHAFKARSKSSVLTVKQIESLLRDGAEVEPVDRKMCCGHDLVGVLTSIIRRFCGKTVSVDGVARALRVALSASDLKSTKLYVEIERWQKMNGVQIWADV